MLEIDAYLLMLVLALAALVATPGHAAADHRQVVADKQHQLVYFCDIKRDDGATFSDFGRCLIHRPSIFEFRHDDRDRRLGVN